MLGGQLKKQLTKEAILNKISAYDVYRYYLGFDFSLGQKYASPFRDEHDGSFSIKMMNDGNLVHKDFGGGGDMKGDCFSFVEQLYPGLTFNDVLVKIDKDMKLGIFGAEGYKDVVRGYRKDVLKPKVKIIMPTIRVFNNEDLKYWKQYGQTEKDLEGIVYSIASYKIGRIRVKTRENELVFGYRGKDNTEWKIYKPFDADFKWTSCTPLTRAYGLGNLKIGERSLIAKSVKDMLVLKKIYPYVCGVQNESLEAFSEETVTYIKNNSSETFYAGDCDNPGKKASWAITEAFGFKHVNVPDEYMEKNIKDFADWAKYEGLKKIEHYLKRKQII